MPDSAPQNAVAPIGRSSVWRLVWNIASVSGRVLLLGCLAVCVASPELIDLDWRFDIVASLIAQACLAGAVLAIWQALFRRWVWCALFAVVTAGGYSWMLRVERAPGTAGHSGGTEVSVLIMNVHSRNDRVEDVLSLIADSDADLVVILESSWGIIRTLPTDAELLSLYPHRQGTDAESSGHIIVLSRHPLFRNRSLDSSPGLASSWGFRAGYVPIGNERIRFGAVHAPSPRTRATWGYGQHTFTRLAQHFDRLDSPMERQEDPVIIAGDLNSSPTGLRSHMVTKDLGLLRAKPLHAWDGTFPATLPWFARSSIDGVFVSQGVAVLSWQTVEIPGSDHRGVLVSLVIGPRSGD